MNKKVILCGNFGVNNHGDEAILSGIISFFSKLTSRENITAFSSSPTFTKNLHNIKSFYLFPSGFRTFFSFLFFGRFFRYFHILYQADYFVIGGGCLFNEKVPKSFFIWFLQCLPPIILRKKIFFLFQSLEPVNGFFFQNILKFILKRSIFISFRDEDSAKIALQLSPIIKTHVFSDPAFLIEHVPNKSNIGAENFIALSLRENKNLTKEKLQILAKFIDKVSNMGFKFVFVPFQTKIENDLRVFNDLQNFTNQKIFIFNGDSFVEVINTLTKSKMIIGMRLHAIIFSILLKKPFFAISYQEKVINFVKKCGLSNCIRVHDLTYNRLIEGFDKARFSNSDLQKNLNNEKELLFKHLDLLRPFFH